MRYAVAEEITGLSHVQLWRLVEAGRLSRQGSGRTGDRDVWLSRRELEAMALEQYHPGRTGPYWLTTQQAADLLGVTPQTVRNRLPTHRAGKRTLLVRRDDVARAAFEDV